MCFNHQSKRFCSLHRAPACSVVYHLSLRSVFKRTISTVIISSLGSCERHSFGELHQTLRAHKPYRCSVINIDETLVSRYFFFICTRAALFFCVKTISVRCMAEGEQEVDKPRCSSPTHSLAFKLAHIAAAAAVGKGPSVWERWREGSIEQRWSAVNHERRQKPPVFPQCTGIC